MASSAADRSIGLYSHQMQWAQIRLNLVAKAWQECPDKRDEVKVALASESMSLQLRMALEAMAFAALATNKDSYLQAHSNGLDHWKAHKIIGMIDAVNPHFYPWQFTIHALEGGTHLEPSASQGFDRSQFVEAYEGASVVLHAQSPFLPKRDYFAQARKVAKWARLASGLIDSHVVELPGHGFIQGGVNAKSMLWNFQLLQAKDGGSYAIGDGYPRG